MVVSQVVSWSRRSDRARENRKLGFRYYRKLGFRYYRKLGFRYYRKLDAR